MPLTYENLVRGVLLLLLVAGSLTANTVPPSITLLSFIAFEFMVRKLEKPKQVKDFSVEVAAITAKQEELDKQFKEIRDNISIGAMASAIKRR